MDLTRPRTEPVGPALQRTIEHMITSGELSGGDRVNESALALRLGVSRAPIREACRALERIGLLRSEINRGFFVREISTREALDLYDLRASLSALVGRLAAARVTGAQLEALAALVDRMDQAATREDLSVFYPLNVEFHTRLVACTENHKLMQIWPTLEGELHLFRRRGLVQPGSLRKSNYQHRQMVALLRAGDGEGAARLMEQHIVDGKARLLRSLPETR